MGFRFLNALYHLTLNDASLMHVVIIAAPHVAFAKYALFYLLEFVVH